MADLGDVAHAAEDPVRDARRAARAPRDLDRRLGLDLDAEDARRAVDDRRELLRRVVVEAERHAEAVAKRRRQQARARRRADQRERRKVERERPRRRPLTDDDVEPEVLERRVEDLLDGAVQPVDLVDEQDVALLEPGEDRRHVALPLERGAGDRADADAELLAHDEREGRLAEPRRADEQDVVERLAARLRGVERDRELLLDPLLPDEVVELARAERAVELVLLGRAPSARGTAWRSCRLPERRAHLLFDRQVLVDLGERALGVDDVVAELDERVACGQVGRLRTRRRP